MIYLISSTSYNLINDEVSKIFKSLDDVEIIDYNKTTLEEIITSFGYISLFMDEKKIIVKNASIFSGKSDKNSELLEKYLENPNPSTTIIFTTFDKVDERKKITKIIKDKYKYVNINTLNGKELVEKVISIFKNKKYNISYDNAKYICNAALNNYDLILMEVEKVLLYYLEPCEIELSVLEEIISHSMDDNNFKFIDAYFNKDYNLAIKLLNYFKIQKIEPLVLFSLLAREFRLTILAKQGNIDSMHLQSWQVDKLNKRAYNYSLEELEDKLIEILDIDYSIKTSGIDKYLALELFILK